jgi:hypothetical protein
LKTVTILKRSKNQLGLKLEVVGYILNSLFVKHEENQKSTNLYICIFVKPFVPYFSLGEKWAIGSPWFLVFKQKHVCSFGAHKRIAADKCNIF